MCVYKVTDKVSDCWPLFQGLLHDGLYQVQVAHEACPSVLLNPLESFQEFLKEISCQPGKEFYPDSTDMLLHDGGVRLVLTDNDDPDSVGFVSSTA